MHTRTNQRRLNAHLHGIQILTTLLCECGEAEPGAQRIKVEQTGLSRGVAQAGYRGASTQKETARKWQSVAR